MYFAIGVIGYVVILITCLMAFSSAVFSVILVGSRMMGRNENRAKQTRTDRALGRVIDKSVKDAQNSREPYKGSKEEKENRGKGKSEMSLDRQIEGYEQYPLLTKWGYDLYQQLSDYMTPKQAMSRASQVEATAIKTGQISPEFKG